MVLNWTPRCGPRPFTVVLGKAGHESTRYSVVLGVGHIKIPRCSVLAGAEYQHHGTRCVPQKMRVSACVEDSGRLYMHALHRGFTIHPTATLHALLIPLKRRFEGALASPMMFTRPLPGTR